MVIDFRESLDICRQEIDNLNRQQRMLQIAIALTKTKEQPEEVIEDIVLLLGNYQSHLNYALDTIRAELTDILILLHNEAKSREKTSRLENPHELN